MNDSPKLRVRTILLCGATLAAVNFGRILLFEPQTGAAVALAVSLSLLVTVMVSKCLGGLLPNVK